MAAYNWIHTDATCPSCQEMATIRCQTHIASSFDGDETGRFFDRVFSIGDKMPWFPEGHPEYETWCFEGDPWTVEDAREACYSTCQKCHAELYAVIQFSHFTPVRVLEIGFQKNWPKGYHK
jgi:hypothetical protein